MNLTLDRSFQTSAWAPPSAGHMVGDVRVEQECLWRDMQPDNGPVWRLWVDFGIRQMLSNWSSKILCIYVSLQDFSCKVFSEVEGLVGPSFDHAHPVS
jgi:hypothetical protein